ncbi:hypothetical protein HT031_002009 [Scenedesmus sp. PABB004]|nr:hypothetical protein HT031_002009 [Scenedesmus sp. PABB004]
MQALRVPSAAAAAGRSALLRGKVVPLSRPSVSRKAAVPQALFGGLFGGKKAESGGAGGRAASPNYFICIDCGWIYPDGDIKKAPGSFKCPVCSSPKSRFKVYKGVVKGRPNNTGAALKQRFAKREW